MLKWIIGGGVSTPNDTESENKFLSEKWHSYSGFVDLEKIKQNIITVKFFVENQINLEYYFTESEFNYILQKPDLLTSKRFKKEGRTGVPIKYTKDLILRMFNVDLNNVKENYKTRFISIFKNRDPKNIGDHVPYLSYFESFEENLNVHFLNSEGIQATKELLWLLYSVVPNIEFCPLLIKIISFSLIFISKEECFTFLKNLIINDYSIKKLSKIRFRLRFNYEENKRLIPAFIESFRNISKFTGKEILNKFEKIGFDVEVLVEDMFFNFFLGYLNFNFLHRVYIQFLLEGSKILFRTAYAIFKLFKNDILDITKPELVISTIKSKCKEMKDFNTFFTTAFSFKLNTKNNKYDEIKIVESFKPSKLYNYYIPTINGDSSILLDDDIFQLWSIFPDNFKSRDAKLIYSTYMQGCSLSKIYDVCSDSENSCFNCFMIIMTKKFDVFGVIMSLPFDKNRIGFYKPAYTGLFVLRPYVERYDINIHNNSNNEHEKVVMCGEEKLIIGLGSDGPALEIDKDLIIGFSYKSDIFSSPCLAASNLNKNDFSFEIARLEIFILY